MTPIAPHISTFLRERLPHQRGASPHTCDSYAYSFQLLFEFASQRVGRRPSALTLEQIDASLVMDFLAALETELNEVQRDLLETSRNSALSLLYLLNDVLDFSGMETKSVELDSTTFDLSKLVADTVRALQFRLSRRACRWIVEFHPRFRAK